MTAMTNLDVLLKSMSPKLVEGDYVFCTVNNAISDYVHLDPVATFREQEGLTLVLEKDKAIACDLDFDATFSLITLTVHSSFEAVGLTAAFANKLAAYGVSVNVIAGYYHDHIFVQKEKATMALAALKEFASAPYPCW